MNLFEQITNAFLEPLNSNVMIDFLSDLNAEVPPIGEKEYKSEGITVKIHKVKTDFSFNELSLENDNSNGIPVLESFSIYAETKICLPYDLTLSDSYKDISKKLKSEAQYRNKRIKTMRYWVLQRSDGFKYMLAIRFKDKSLEKIGGFLVKVFLPEDERRLLKIE